jgi:hypothetical protein
MLRNSEEVVARDLCALVDLVFATIHMAVSFLFRLRVAHKQLNFLLEGSHNLVGMAPNLTQFAHFDPVNPARS